MRYTAITELWCDIASSVPIEQNTPMLKAIIKLWTNIRVHYFCPEVVRLNPSAVHHSKAIRKTLKDV